MGLKGLVIDTDGIPIRSATIQVKKARNLVDIKHDIITGFYIGTTTYHKLQQTIFVKVSCIIFKSICNSGKILSFITIFTALKRCILAHKLFLSILSL